MLKLTVNKRDKDMVELSGADREGRFTFLWGMFHIDTVYDEIGDLYSRLRKEDEIEVVIISRTEYDRLKRQ